MQSYYRHRASCTPNTGDYSRLANTWRGVGANIWRPGGGRPRPTTTTDTHYTLLQSYFQSVYFGFSYVVHEEKLTR